MNKIAFFILCICIFLVGGCKKKTQEPDPEPETIWRPLGNLILLNSAPNINSPGFSLTLSGDGNTLVTGSISGGAYVHVRSGNTWMQQGPILAAGANNGEGGGYSVAISRDGNRIATGGPFHNSNSGNVWVYTRSNGIWTREGVAVVSRDSLFSTNFYYGSSVALSADGNTLLVGAVGGNGAAYVFTRNSGVWSQQGSALTGQGVQTSFGQFAALSADGNTAVISGPKADNAGAVWTFVRTNGVWAQSGTKLLPAFSVGASYFGGLDLDSNGKTLLVGAQFDDNSLGGAWLYNRSGNAWVLVDKLKPKDPAEGGKFGLGIALDNAGNRLVICGYGDGNTNGGAWSYQKTNNTVQPLGAILRPKDPGMLVNFGMACCMSNDGKVLAVSSISAGSASGSVQVYRAD